MMLYNMSRDVEYIQNFTAFGIFDDTGEFSIQGGFPTNPDEVVIRSISYSQGQGIGYSMMLVQSNLSPLLCVVGSGQFCSNPGTRIQTRNPLPNILTLKMMKPTTPPEPTDAGDVELHEICISMDFIKYKPVQK